MWGIFGICHLYLVLCLEFVFGRVFGICIWSCIWSILWAAHERRGVVVGACYADIADHQVTGKSGGVQSKGRASQEQSKGEERDGREEILRGTEIFRITSSLTRIC